MCLRVHPLGLLFDTFIIAPSVPPFTTMTPAPSTPGRELPRPRAAQALRRLHLLPLESGRPGPGCSLAVPLRLRASAGWVLREQGPQALVARRGDQAATGVGGPGRRAGRPVSFLDTSPSDQLAGLPARGAALGAPSEGPLWSWPVGAGSRGPLCGASAGRAGGVTAPGGTGAVSPGHDLLCLRPRPENFCFSGARY